MKPTDNTIVPGDRPTDNYPAGGDRNGDCQTDDCLAGDDRNGDCHADDCPAGDDQRGARHRFLPRLFLTMLKIGLFAFGGGYAMTALLENELVTKRSWLGRDEFLNMTAIAESTPGPIAVNSATYVGYRLAGVPGAAVATLGVCLPAFLIIYAISLFFDRFVSLTYVAYAFRGVQAAVVYLIASAGVRLFRGLGRDPLGRTLAVVTAAALVALSLFSVRFSSVFFILIGGVVGVAAMLIRRARRGGDAK